MENEIAKIATLFLGIAIGATMEAEHFLKPATLAIFGLGFVAICLDTVVPNCFTRRCPFGAGANLKKCKVWASRGRSLSLKRHNRRCAASSRSVRVDGWVGRHIGTKVAAFNQKLR